jgi:putative ATP-binding cassette transporter
MANNNHLPLSRRALVHRFWHVARGYWTEDAWLSAWLLTIGLLVLALLQLAFQYRLNVWNRDLFDAIEKKNGPDILTQAIIFVPLAMAAVGLAVISVFGRMKMQREWRAWVTDRIVGRWLAHGHYYRLNLMTGEPQVPESRITDDTRAATDAPVDFALGIFQSVITAITFIGVLWFVGGSFEIELGGSSVLIPGYVVIAALIYSLIISIAMILIARNFIPISEATSQADAEFRYAITRLRENGESIALLGGEEEEQRGLRRALHKIVTAWRRYSYQHMRATVVTNANYLLAPTIPLIICAPKYIAGTMTLGEMTQVAAAFVQVQSSFSWLVDNYPRFADWIASVRRSAFLLVALDHLETAEIPGEPGVINRSEQDDAALRLQDLSVTLDDGTVVIDDADAVIGKNERVLVVGESGTGKSTLVRAIAGLWPWGQGEISVRRGARLFLMPQKPYVPLGTLRRVLTYPLPSNQVPNDKIDKLMKQVGLEYMVDRLDVDTAWDHILSGGEKQRIAFVRLLLHVPDIVVMDEATSALDPASQERLMKLVAEHLPNAAVISIAHRPELEAFHDRKLVFEHRPDGSRLISDQVLHAPVLLRRHLRRQRSARH